MPVRTLCCALLTLMLLSATRRNGVAVQSAERQAPLRQQVVIFVIDTHDAFDAHGVYVQSVISQQCPACQIQPSNLQGDLSMPSLLLAFQDIVGQRHAYPASTTLLVNISLGTYTYEEPLHTLVRQLDAAGVVLIASAGNDATEKPFYPAAFPEVLAVCASTRYTKTRAPYSNFGPWVDLCAPGLQYVTQPLQHGSLASGTSFAGPMVAGILGQLLLDAPCASPQAGRRALLRTAEHNDKMEAGLVNRAAAAHYLQSLYACEQPAVAWDQRLLEWARRSGQHILTYGLLLVYFVASIFVLPLLLAYGIERYERRIQRQQQEAVRRAYQGSPAYRQQRIAAIRARARGRQRVRWRDQPELTALVDALFLYYEPCWWCARPAAELEEETTIWQEPTILWCRRCKQELTL